MNHLYSRALELLAQSLRPIPLELNELDWKSGLSDKSDRLAQHISAFANYSGGGFMAFGVANDGVINTLTKEEMDGVVTKIGNIARNNLAQPIGIEHAVLEFENQPILFIYIPEYYDKPVHLRSGDIFESYKRSAGQTVKLTRPEAKQLIAHSTGLSFESQIAQRDLNDDEILKILDHDSYFRLQDKRLPEKKQGILQMLESDELIVKSNSLWNITNLGALLFARDITVFKDIKRKATRVIVYKATGRVETIKEQDEKKGYASGFEGLIQYILDQFPTNEVIENALRHQVKIYPEKAIREFVANAIIHQDMAVTGVSVMIEIFIDRIEITNPGVPLVDTNRFIDTPPRSRNEMLASLMRRLNICEERGSGVDRAIEAIEIYQLPAPKFIRGEDYTQVIIYAPKSLSKMDKEDRIRACYQHTSLQYVNNQIANNQSIRKRFSIAKNNYPMASKIISETMEAKLIKPSDPENSSKKFSTYVPYWA
jgi:ATP-dependent DNA helicase RecG